MRNLRCNQPGRSVGAGACTGTGGRAGDGTAVARVAGLAPPSVATEHYKPAELVNLIHPHHALPGQVLQRYKPPGHDAQCIALQG